MHTSVCSIHLYIYTIYICKYTCTYNINIYTYRYIVLWKYFCAHICWEVWDSHGFAAGYSAFRHSIWPRQSHQATWPRRLGMGQYQWNPPRWGYWSIKHGIRRWMNTCDTIHVQWIILMSRVLKSDRDPSRSSPPRGRCKCTFSLQIGLGDLEPVSLIGPWANWMAWALSHIATVGGRLNDCENF